MQIQQEENKKLSFNPICKNITFSLVIPEVLAKVTFTDGKLSVESIQGNLSDWEVITE